MQEVEAAGRSMGLQTIKFVASGDSKIDAAFQSISQQNVDAALVGTDG